MISMSFETSIKLASLEATNIFGQRLGSNLRGGEVIELKSDLGGGKTTLVKAIVAGTGSRDNVSSPSFGLINEYSTSKFKIYHLDFYRLTDPGIMEAEVKELIEDKSNVVIIEWADSIADFLPEQRLVIDIKVENENSRLLRIKYASELTYLKSKDIG